MTKTVQFKTNINCSRCVRTVRVFLEDVKGIESWKVDTTDPAKILTIQAKQAAIRNITAAVEDAGFKIEEIH